jgi:DNA-binding CsgD family transcriptional regulator/tetratricopeptide (TPR) repeat protein
MMRGIRAVLVGRDAESVRVRDALAADRSILVVGEPGIGKTSLIRAAIASSGRRGFEGGGFATLAWMPHLALNRATGLELRGDADWIAAAVERVVGPEILFVDDLQWVDPGTIEVLSRLVGRLAIVGATRLDGDAATAAIDALGTAGAERLDLGRLAASDAVILARQAAPDLPAGRAARLAERGGGNPYLIETLALGGESESLQLAVAARLHGLPDVELEALGRLALADRPLERDVLGERASGLIERGLAVETPTGLVVRHALLAEAVIAGLDESSRRRHHSWLAAHLDGPGERARHLRAAGDLATAHALALEAVTGATSPGERAAHLGVAAATAEGDEGDDLRVEAAAALRTAGDLDGARALLAELTTGDPETRGRASAILARVCWSSGDPDGMRAAIATGLEAVGGSGSRSEAMLWSEAVVITALVEGRFEDGLRESEAALALADRSGGDRARPLLLRATILTGLGRDGWIEALEAVMDAGRAAGDAETELSAANNLVTGHEMHGRPAAGQALAERMLERARVLRLAGWERQFGALLIDLDLHAGRLEAALGRAEALLEEPLDPLADQQVGLAAALALVDSGRFEQAGPLLARLLASAPDDVTGRGDVLYVSGEAALWAGRPDDALRQVDGYRRYEGSEYPTSHLVDVLAGWAAVDAGSGPPAALARIEPSGMLVGAALERAAIDRFIDSAFDEAAAGFDAAAEAYIDYHRRGELRARWAAAEARRRAGELDLARRELEAVEADALAHGFTPLVGRIQRSLRLAGVRRARSSPVERGPAGPRLTAREREICELVAAGASNIEVARRLGLGRPTVARLLSSAMAKLGVDSRAQVAAEVAQLA